MFLMTLLANCRHIPKRSLAYWQHFHTRIRPTSKHLIMAISQKSVFLSTCSIGDSIFRLVNIEHGTRNLDLAVLGFRHDA